MLDWNITEAEVAPAPEEETPPPRRTRRGFYLIMGTLLMGVVAVTSFILWQRLHEREVLIESDLVGQIRAEESARHFGDLERIPTLIGAAVPGDWRTRFTRQFVTPNGAVQAVGEITLDSVTYDGVQADVQVRLGAQVQRRAYEQTPQGWRRVPVGLDHLQFGSISVLLGGHTDFTHHQSDADFVRHLATDLPGLEQTVRAWYGDSATVPLPPELIPPFITVQPAELSPPLASSPNRDRSTLVINSPQVVALPAGWNISAASGVRFALAEAVWGQFPPERFSTVNLPGTPQFITALQSVLALRWALTPEEYTALTRQWQAHSRTTPWQSPFFALGEQSGTIDPFAPEAYTAPGEQGGAIDPFAPHDDSVRLLVVADALVETIGAPGVAQIRPTLAHALNWDDFFTTLVSKPTLEFEAVLRGSAVPAAMTMPFTATLAPAMANPAHGFAVNVAGHPHPMVVESVVGGAEVVLPNGERLHPRCAARFGELEIEGTWREQGLRLTPTHIKVNTVRLPTTFTDRNPPAGTLAYLADYRDGNGSEVAGIAHVSALTADGTFTPVLTPNTMNVVPFSSTSNSTTGMMFTIFSGADGCGYQWYLRYVPGAGITGAWLVPQTRPTTYLLPRWDDRSGRGMMVEINTLNPSLDHYLMPFWWLDEGAPEVLGAPDGYLPAGSSYLLAPHSDAVMVYQVARPDSTGVAIVIVDVATLSEQAVYEPPSTSYYALDFAYGADGKYLYVAWQIPRTSGGPPQSTALQRIELATGDVKDSLSQEQGMLYGAAPDLQASFAYAITLSAADASGVRLMKVTDEESVLLNYGRNAVGITLVLRCGAGGMLYLRQDTPTDQAPRYDLDPRSIHITTFDDSGAEQSQVLPLATTQFPLMCP